MKQSNESRRLASSKPMFKSVPRLNGKSSVSKEQSIVVKSQTELYPLTSLLNNEYSIF